MSLQEPFHAGLSLVSSPAYFSHAERKNSLVNGLFRFRSVRFKNWWRHVFKNVLCDVTQVMTLWNSAKETARSRDHPSRGFRTPRNEDSQNLKPLSTSESAKTILSTSEAQELHPASWQAQKHIPCVYGSPHIPSLVRSLVLSGLVSCIMLQPPSLLWSPFMQYVTSLSWSNLIGVPPMWRFEQKRNRPLTRLFFPSACEK